MTIPEAIEQLAIKLALITDGREQAEILLLILDKYRSINSKNVKPFVDQLVALADKLNSDRYRAWAMTGGAMIKRLDRDYNSAIEISLKTLSLFQDLDDKKGIVESLINIGIGYHKKGDYIKALDFYSKSLATIAETGTKQGLASTYNNMGYVYQIQGDYQESLNKHSEALRVAGESEDEAAKVASYSGIANSYFLKSNYSDALKYFFLGKEIAQRIDFKQGLANAFNNIANVYVKTGEYPLALENYFASLKIKEDIGDEMGIADSHNGIGTFYLERDEYTKAIEHFSIAKDLYIALYNKKGIALSTHNLGVAHKYSKNFPIAFELQSEALRISEEIGYWSLMPPVYSEIGTFYLMQNDYPEALYNLQEGLNLSEEIEDEYGIAICRQGIGLVYQKEERYVDALYNLEMAFEIASKLSSPQILKEIAESLTTIYRLTNNPESALKYFRIFHDSEKKVMGGEVQQQIDTLNFKHENEQRDKDLETEHQRNVELKEDKDRTDILLHNILPPDVAEELKIKGGVEGKDYDNVTVLFADFVGFTTISERLTPQQLFSELHTCFSAFDEICERHHIEKIKTVGDAYLAISGLPLANPHHAQDMLRAAIDIRDFMQQRAIQVSPLGGDLEGGATFQVRLGIDSGSVIAGIVGVRKFAYDIWGDTVNTAARMEQNSEPGKINISETTYQLVRDEFECQYRGEIEAKNKGMLKMYFVNG